MVSKGYMILNNYMVSNDYFYLMIVICLYKVIWFQVTDYNNTLEKPDLAKKRKP